ncbi:phosphopantetheine-binding protein [Streptomyces globisporus]|uniref:phosphopantetheine-binding protein n=1 Tax=Streptomyces globisporus TaxID=1908 RepID=UPI0036F83745
MSDASPTEKDSLSLVADIWCEVLELPEVGEDDNFFDLGGQSLLLQSVQAAIARRTGRQVELIDLFDHPTVRALARHLDSGSTPRPAARRRSTAGRLGGRRAALGGGTGE